MTLVEKVKIALRQVDDLNGVTDADGEARAAITAVADWIGPEYCVTQSNLLMQLKEGEQP